MGARGGEVSAILVVLGTRPEAIKLAPVVLELQQRAGATVRVCSTGQHREMLASVLGFFGVSPNVDLAIMRVNQSLNDIVVNAVAGIDRVLSEFAPDWVLVQGDTTTAFACALAAFHRGIKVGHVEAGLRSHDRSQPYPEEVNRRMTAAVADLHFCPTARARGNLIAEGVPDERVHVVGNTVIDALHLAVRRISHSDVNAAIAAGLPRFTAGKPLVLVTGHRRESFGERFRELCQAIRDFAESNSVEIIYPVHLNPNVRRPVADILEGLSNVHLIEPVGYPALVWLLKRCRFVLTDSGGIQEEAATLGKPVLVMRDVTERTESIEAGVSRLVGTDRGAIREWSERLLHDDAVYRRMSREVNVYGDGRASGRIADVLGVAT
jgi:UDP-N-acetylglucosamine 2-epimerase (non-hydrolysing)